MKNRKLKLSDVKLHKNRKNYTLITKKSTKKLD